MIIEKRGGRMQRRRSHPKCLKIERGQLLQDRGVTENYLPKSAYERELLGPNSKQINLREELEDPADEAMRYQGEKGSQTR